MLSPRAGHIQLVAVAELHDARRFETDSRLDRRVPPHHTKN